MTAHRSETGRRRLVLAVLATALITALTAGALAAVFAGVGRADDPSGGLDDGATIVPSCTVPDLPGTVVTVFLSDMGVDADGQHGRMTSGTAMFLSADPAAVPNGNVSFLAINGGRLTHQLIVMPLAPGENAGERVIVEGSTVAETGLLGEASATCGSGEGQGILPDSSSWVTLTLPPGRYELLCNFPGHYAAGMHAEFTVGQVEAEN
ncbi:hypothetical protein [Microcella sp.]|uniref:hypothetical protein n=1 Tax=Microcella sp. TaxID=1913979 RepID=UPI002560B72F|nr:hypothetical protein [Microcella sp.]MBX9471217.1 hypothetical protein [Microcella sp.]